MHVSQIKGKGFYTFVKAADKNYIYSDPSIGGDSTITETNMLKDDFEKRYNDGKMCTNITVLEMEIHNGMAFVKENENKKKKSTKNSKSSDGVDFSTTMSILNITNTMF